MSIGKETANSLTGKTLILFMHKDFALQLLPPASQEHFFQFSATPKEQSVIKFNP